MSATSSAIVWFDLPVHDLSRAIAFYSKVLGKPVEKQDIGGHEFAVVPHGEGSVGGCLSKCEDIQPSSNSGPLLYFNVSGRLDEAVRLAGEHGGKILNPSHPIGPWGYRAIILDTEGNRIALHSS